MFCHMDTDIFNNFKNITDIFINYNIECIQEYMYVQSLLLPMCHRSKKWSMAGFPSSRHFLGQSSLIHFAIDWWRLEMKDLMINPVPSKNAKAFWWPKNSMLELLPASLA